MNTTRKPASILSSSNRRQFLAASGAAALGLMLGSASAQEVPGFKTRLQRAMIIGEPDEKTLREYKDAGFDGVETRAVLPEDQAKRCREIAEKLGMQIHAVLVGGGDAAKLEDALRAAHGYGADAVLFVPARVSKITMPEAWEYDIQFDPKTGHLSRVVAGDNAKYAQYIAAHNAATDDARQLVQKAVPLAERLDVTIALENVWNNLWVRPDHFRWLVASFGTPWVRAYYDVGNNEKYLIPAEDWIRTLGKLLVKIHIKDFQLNPDRHGGKFVHPRDGGIHWPKVRQALDEVGYNGYLTIEDGGLPLKEFRQRLDLIIAGK